MRPFSPTWEAAAQEILYRFPGVPVPLGGVSSTLPVWSTQPRFSRTLWLQTPVGVTGIIKGPDEPVHQLWPGRVAPPVAACKATVGSSPAESEADPSVFCLVNERGQRLVRVVLQLRQVPRATSRKVTPVGRRRLGLTIH